MLKISPLRLAAASAVILLIIAVAIMGYVQGATIFKDSETFAAKVERCRTSSLQILKPISVDVDLLKKISVLCYNDIRRTNILGESSITRGAYIHQGLENNVILAMVVTITLSGVALATLQLLTSYNLTIRGIPAGNASTDLILEQGRLSIRSSITGVIVLAISLAFFGIYVVWVYSIREDTVKNVVEGDDSKPIASVNTIVAPPSTPPHFLSVAPPRIPKGARVILTPGGLGSPVSGPDAGSSPDRSLRALPQATAHP